MRRKNPKSHIYTIAILSLTLVAAGVYALADIDTTEDKAVKKESNPSQKAEIKIENNDDLSQLVIDDSNYHSVQNSTPGIQSAAGSDVYEQYDSQNQGSYQPQGTE